MTYPGGGQGGWGDQSGQGGWGQSDYGDYGTDRYPTTGGFPQQGYGSSYGGLGVFSGGDEPPKKDNKKLWLVIGAVVLVLLGGGITTLLVVNNKETPPVTQSTSETPPPTEESTEESTSTPPKTSDCKPRKAGTTCVATSLGYNYDVPKGWEANDDRLPIPSMAGVTLTGTSSYGAYKCDGKDFTKGTNGGALVDKGDINKVAGDLAKAVATDFYTGATNDVKVGQPKAIKFPHKTKDGKDITVEGVQVDATVTTTGNKCLATKGVVKVLLLVGTTKFHALVVNGDLEGGGGGDKPPLMKDADLQAMIDSLTPTS